MSSPFFPPWAARDILDFVLAEFPFPLALTYARLHQQADGRQELANALASVLMNKGNALDILGQLAEALASYDAAIAIVQRLVEVEGRRALAGGLAMALASARARGPAAVTGSADVLRCGDALVGKWYAGRHDPPGHSSTLA